MDFTILIDLFSNILIWIIIVFAGIKILAWALVTLTEPPEQVISPRLAANGLSCILIRVERYADQFYFFQVTSDKFICQGRNLGELSDIFNKRFQNTIFQIVEGKDDVLEALKLTSPIQSAHPAGV